MISGFIAQKGPMIVFSIKMPKELVSLLNLSPLLLVIDYENKIQVAYGKTS